MDDSHSTNSRISKAFEMYKEAIAGRPVQGGIRASTRYQILKRDGFRCQYCGATPAQSKLHLDHIVPLSLGGSDHDWNIITACSKCNLGKGGISPDKHLPSRESLLIPIRTAEMIVGMTSADVFVATGIALDQAGVNAYILAAVAEAIALQARADAAKSRAASMSKSCLQMQALRQPSRGTA